MAVTNPCGLSVDDTLRIIKDNVLTGTYSGRNQVLDGLMNDPALNLKYSEAKQVTDYYFSVYRKIAAQNKSKAPIVHQTAEQKAQRQVDNMAIDFLIGNSGAFALTDADIKHIEELYEQADKADTPTLKARFDEQANVFISKFNPTYANELFRSSVYARPLLSAVFFIKSFTSNWAKQIERSLTDSIWDGRKIDFTPLWKYKGLANASMLNVFSGGIPATTIAHNELFDFSKGRLEEFSLKGSPLENAGIAKKNYFKVMKAYSKWSNRLNAAPDTRGIYANAERHMYQLLKEKYRDMYEEQTITVGMSNKEIKNAKSKADIQATQQSVKDMALDDFDTSTKMAVAKFNELKLPITHNNGKLTSEFKVAVQEYQRLNRDHVIWAKALELSKNDFWKKNMTVASELGFGDYGVFGLQAQLFASIKNKIEAAFGTDKSKSKLGSAFNLFTFGFLNGASNFAEDAIERFPLYGLVKLAALQYKKKHVTDRELIHDIARRQKDIVVKTVITAAYIATLRMLEKLICPDRQDVATNQDLSTGRAQIGLCGIPFLVPPQMMPVYKVYNIISNAIQNEDDFWSTILNVFPVLVQSNEMGLGGTLDKIGTSGSEYAAAMAQGNNIRGEELKAKLVKDVVRGGCDFANSFLPIPSRALNEIGTGAQRIEGRPQRQQDLNIAINNAGSPLSWYNSLGKVAVASLGNVTGIKEMWLAGIGSDKPYAVDWQGRRVIQLRGSDIIGNGIQYNQNDELLIDAGIRPPYVARTEKVPTGKKVREVLDFRPDIETKKVDKEMRYMTNNEFFIVNEALGQFNEEYFNKHRGKMQRVMDKEGAEILRGEIQPIFRATKKAAIEAVSLGNKSARKILNYVKANWETTRDQTITEIEIKE